MKRHEREKERALKAETDSEGFFIVQFLFIYTTQKQSKIWDSQKMIDLVDYEVLGLRARIKKQNKEISGF